MESAELLETLVGLAREAGLEVRGISAREAEGDATSGVCRVRGSVWVILCGNDPAEMRIDVLAAALRGHAAPLLESRYLPPALRERIGGG